MARSVRPTRVMRIGGWHVWDEALGDYVPEGAPVGPPAPPPPELRLEHPESIDPARTYRLSVLRPPRVHGTDPMRQEIEITGDRLLEWTLGENRDPARVVGETVRVPVLDVFNPTSSAVWADLNEVRRLLFDGHVVLNNAGYCMGFGKWAASPLAGKTWSSWRRREEARIVAEAQAAKVPAEVESAEEPPAAVPTPRRGSPWRRRSEEVKSDE